MTTKITQKDLKEIDGKIHFYRSKVEREIYYNPYELIPHEKIISLRKEIERVLQNLDLYSEEYINSLIIMGKEIGKSFLKSKNKGNVTWIRGL